MYVGRIVAVGRSESGPLAALYRVSSRSFPNRHAVVFDRSAAIVPKPGYEGDIHKNPYIAYNCLRLTGDFAVVGNGSHTDPICEKIDSGLPVRDALSSVLLAMDYEHDAYNTPRIAAVCRSGSSSAFLGIVRKDALLVRELEVQPGHLFYLCTYERNEPAPHYYDEGFQVENSAAACDYILGQGVFADFERPVTAACAVADEQGSFSLASREAAVPSRSN